MLAEVERMKDERRSRGEELAKAVKQFTAATLASRKTMQGQAQDLGGNWMAASDLNFSARYLEAVKRVTPAELQRVARQYLTAENRTLYALLPTGTAPAARDHRCRPTADHPSRNSNCPTACGCWSRRIIACPSSSSARCSRAACWRKRPANNGMTLLMAKMLLKGTTSRTAEQIATRNRVAGRQHRKLRRQQQLRRQRRGPERGFRIRPGPAGRRAAAPGFPCRTARARAADPTGQHPGPEGTNCSQRLPPDARRACSATPATACRPSAPRPACQLHPDRRLAQPSIAQLVRPQQCVLAIFGDVKPRPSGPPSNGLTWPVGPGNHRFPDPRSHAASAQPGSAVAKTRDKKQAVLVIGFPGAPCMTRTATPWN